MKLPRFITALMAAAGVVGLSWFILGQYTNSILQADSALRATRWAEILVDQVSDLPQTIAGDLPSDESVLFFEQARAIGDVWQYKLYDAKGKLVLMSSQLGRINHHAQNLKDIHPHAAAAIADTGVFAQSRPGNTAAEPDLLSEVVTSITFQNRNIGFLELQIDETMRMAGIRAALTQLAFALLLIVLGAFGGPTIAFLRRSAEKERAEGQLKYLAYHDGLTGLKNRNAINQSLQIQLNFANHRRLAIHIIDLDNFKTLNDTLGHDAGDELLRDVANRLQRLCGKTCDVARLGGDEFVVLQPAIHSHEEAAELAGEIVKALRVPSANARSSIETAASVGTAVFPGDGKTAVDLLKAADTALYVAKSSGRACYKTFKPEYDATLQRRRAVEVALRHGLAAGTFRLALQPLISLKTKSTTSVEALLRLDDPELGLISPAEFIPVAEDCGLITEIGAWVIAEGCRILSVLPAHLRLAVNLSVIQFTRTDLVATVEQAIARSQINPQRLELEITEGLLLKDSDEILEKIRGLRSLGCSLALDDFGSGYSSLKYLWRYPFTKIKIDRSFVSALETSDSAQRIVETIILLAQRLDMKVTAEGVETKAQADMLDQLSCDELQGFLFAKPMRLEELAVHLLREQQSRHCQPGEFHSETRLLAAT